MIARPEKQMFLSEKPEPIYKCSFWGATPDQNYTPTARRAFPRHIESEGKSGSRLGRADGGQ
jgi:hypothetical protein